MQSDVPTLELEWISDDSSETEEFSLVESRKKRRQKRSNVKLSSSADCYKQNQENPGLVKKKGEAE